VIVQSGDFEEHILRTVLDVTAQVHLYTNNVTPRRSLTLSDFDELFGHNYSPVTLQPSDWKFRRDKDGKTVAEAMPTWEFTQGPKTTVYGYFVTSAVTKGWMFADDCDRPITLLNNGERFGLTIRFRPPK
jgi:hypothetical protein